MHKKTSVSMVEGPGDALVMALIGPLGWLVMGLCVLSSKKDREDEIDTASQKNAESAMQKWRRNRKPGETTFEWSTTTCEGYSLTRTYKWTVPKDDTPPSGLSESEFDFSRCIKPHRHKPFLVNILDTDTKPFDVYRHAPNPHLADMDLPVETRTKIATPDIEPFKPIFPWRKRDWRIELSSPSRWAVDGDAK